MLGSAHVIGSRCIKPDASAAASLTAPAGLTGIKTAAAPAA